MVENDPAPDNRISEPLSSSDISVGFLCKPELTSDSMPEE